MSKTKPARRHDAGRWFGVRTRTAAWNFGPEPCFPWAGARIRLKLIKSNWIRVSSIVGDPMTKLGIRKLASTILTSRRSQRHSLALTQGAEKGLKQVNGVLLKPRRGAFGKSVRRKLKTVVFFHDRTHFFRRSVCQSGARLSHKQKKRGVKVGSAESFVLAQERPKKMANWIKTLGSAQYGVSQKIYNKRKQVLRGMRIPYAGSKIVFFWFLNNSFCAAGRFRTS